MGIHGIGLPLPGIFLQLCHCRQFAVPCAAVPLASVFVFHSTMFLEDRQYSRMAPEGIGALNTVLRVPCKRNDDSILYHGYEKLFIVWKLFTRYDSLSVALKPPNATGLLGFGIDNRYCILRQGMKIRQSTMRRSLNYVFLGISVIVG